MLESKSQRDILLSVPSVVEEEQRHCNLSLPPNCYLASDPLDMPLGSGGGTSHLLASVWRQQGKGESFEEWVARELRILVHGGGQSRRLPAYAPAGKLFIPVPAFRWALGERIDQKLLDIQIPLLHRIAEAAPAKSKAMVVSGDVVLRSEGVLPQLPETDVILFGLWAQPEEARNFGVMFCDREDPQRLVKFLQKPPPEKTRMLAKEYMFMFDIGVWLLSERAIKLLMTRSGWDPARQDFAGGVPRNYEMYANWGLYLGEQPEKVDQEISKLSVAVLPLPNGEFYHFGSSRDMIDSTYQLQNLVKDQTKLGVMRGRMYASNFVQNSVFDAPLQESKNNTIWVENSHIPASWRLRKEHILTGVPENDWHLDLPLGACLDFVAVGKRMHAIRIYHLDDTFKKHFGQEDAFWMGGEASKWFENHGIDPSSVCEKGADLQAIPLFPVWNCSKPDTGQFVQWMIDPEPPQSNKFCRDWLDSRRMSAQELTQGANMERISATREKNRITALSRMAANAEQSVFYRLDLEATAEWFVDQTIDLPPPLPDDYHDRLTLLHSRMFRSAVERRREGDRSTQFENEAFDVLRETIISNVERKPVHPVCGVMEDQIVWGRSPVRLDFAGGWTDTPPYCLEFGGTVVNMAVDLNGQPPIQAFARIGSEPVIVLRSIDLGLEERIETYDSLDSPHRLGTGFGIARAAIALAGFHPRFNGNRYGSLRKQLQEFGGGVELSMLAAVPKGSGLGTSSILAGTLLGTLSDMLSLDWDFYELVQRTSALEQMLTSGGGWQDQIGGLLRGAKLIETDPGLDQRPLTRWLPKQLFSDPRFKGRMLLYYTGVTRVAHNILSEVVRGIFLNGRPYLSVIDEIGLNAEYIYDAILRENFESFTEGIRRSWELNKRLDKGTNVPDVQRIIDFCGDELEACKLLGAGGGGYIFMVAKDNPSAENIKRQLLENPPNKKARFVDFDISDTGLQVTRS